MFPLSIGFYVRSLFCNTVRCVLFSFAIISLGKRELVALLLLYSWCHMFVIVICLVLVLGWSAECDCGISWSFSLNFLIVYVIWQDTNYSRFCLCWCFMSKCNRVWSGSITITIYRSTFGTVRKSHRTFTVTRHLKDNKSKAISSLFFVNMIAKPERTQSNAYQNENEHRTPRSQGRYINQ